MHPAWARSLRDQCAAAGKLDRFFFKQWGEHLPGELLPPIEGAKDAPWRRFPDGSERYSLAEYGKPREELPRVGYMKTGKKAAGRLLDGIEHNGMPSP